MKKRVLYLFLTTLCAASTAASARAHRAMPAKSPILFADDSTQQPLITSDQTKTKNEREKEIFQWFRTISEVVQLLSEKHYRTINFSDFMQDALKSAVPNTDAHSSFFSQESYKSAIESTSGEFTGIGISIMNKAPEDDFLIIIDVIQGGPADKGGLKTGDKIVSVDDESIKGLSSDEVVYKLRGKTGSTAKLKIIRDKKPLEFSVKREVIKDQSISCYNLKNQDIYYLSLKIFSETAASQTAKILEKANNSKCKGIILDLRRNPGGVLDSAVDMASLFLEKGTLVVSTKDKNKNNISSYSTKSDPIFKANLPLFILIDNFTASASEILAGCLRHYSDQPEANNKKCPLIFLVGTNSFGKGSVQEVIPISNGCALKITTMLYYLPNDVSIQAKGIAPDFLIKPKTIPEEEMKWVNELYGKETSLKHHITENEVLGKPDDPEKVKKEKELQQQKEEQEENKEELAKNWEERHQKAIAQDEQIHACINLINLFNVAKRCTPDEVSTRQKALVFLRKHFVADDGFEVEQIK